MTLQIQNLTFGIESLAYFAIIGTIFAEIHSFVRNGIIDTREYIPVILYKYPCFSLFKHYNSFGR